MSNQHSTQVTEPRWYNSNYLPHFDTADMPQFVTYRLAGSLPVRIREQYKRQLEEGRISEIEYHYLIDKYLDEGHGPDFLKLPAIAQIVEENLLRFDGERYVLHGWVIMPTHVHILFTIVSGFRLAQALHSMKSFTANKANRILGRTGPFWAREYYDRYIRSYEHFVNTVRYIDENPVKAGLCRRAKDWAFGSARMLVKE